MSDRGFLILWACFAKFRRGSHMWASTTMASEDRLTEVFDEVFCIEDVVGLGGGLIAYLKSNGCQVDGADGVMAMVNLPKDAGARKLRYRYLMVRTFASRIAVRRIGKHPSPLK